MLIPAGRTVDRIGARLPLILGGVGAAMALMLAAVATSPLFTGLGLFGFGLAGAFVAVAGTATITREFAVERRGLALGVRQMSVAAGGLVAAFLLPGLAGLGGVPLALAVSGVLTGVLAVAFGRSLPAGPHRVAPSPSVRGVPGIGVVLAAATVQVVALTAVLNFSVPALRDGGASTGQGVILFAVVSLGAMAGRIGWGRLADANGGTRRWLTLRDVAVVTVVAALAYWAVEPLGPEIRLVLMFPLAAGAMGANGLLYLIAGEMAGPARAGTAAGIVSTMLFGVSAAASPLLGLLADHAGFEVLWPVCAAFGAGTLLIVFSQMRPAPPHRDDADPRTACL